MGVEVLVELSLPELNEAEPDVTEDHFLALLADVQQGFQAVACCAARLRAGGWSAALAGSDVICRHPRVRTARQAERRLERLGICPSRVFIRSGVGAPPAAARAD